MANTNLNTVTQFKAMLFPIHFSLYLVFHVCSFYHALTGVFVDVMFARTSGHL